MAFFQYFCPQSHFQEHPLSAQPPFVPAAHVETAVFPANPRIPRPDLWKHPPDFAGARPRAATNPPHVLHAEKNTARHWHRHPDLRETPRAQSHPRGASEPSGGHICRMRGSNAPLTPALAGPFPCAGLILSPRGRIRYLVSNTQPGKGRALCGLLLFLKPARDPRRSREAERERKFPAPDSGWEIPRKLPGAFFFFFPSTRDPPRPGNVLRWDHKAW